MKQIYSTQAVADLDRLRAFIAEKNPHAAQRVGQDLVERLENLRSFPRIGVSVPSAPDPDSIRDMVFGKYIVRYSLHTEAVIVLRIWHHYEDRSQD